MDEMALEMAAKMLDIKEQRESQRDLAVFEAAVRMLDMQEPRRSQMYLGAFEMALRMLDMQEHRQCPKVAMLLENAVQRTIGM